MGFGVLMGQALRSSLSLEACNFPLQAEMLPTWALTKGGRLEKGPGRAALPFWRKLALVSSENKLPERGPASSSELLP